VADIHAEAVEAAQDAVAASEFEDWLPRDSGRPVVELILAAALPRLHERWLAKVEGALRDEGPARAWFQTSCPGKGWWPTWAADYLADVFGAGAGAAYVGERGPVLQHVPAGAVVHRKDCSWLGDKDAECQCQGDALGAGAGGEGR
jgi:hypothetical protein